MFWKKNIDFNVFDDVWKKHCINDASNNVNRPTLVSIPVPPQKMENSCELTGPGTKFPWIITNFSVTDTGSGTFYGTKLKSIDFGPFFVLNSSGNT